MRITLEAGLPTHATDCGGGGWVFLMQSGLRNTGTKPLDLILRTVAFTMKWEAIGGF